MMFLHPNVALRLKCEADSILAPRFAPVEEKAKSIFLTLLSSSHSCSAVACRLGHAASDEVIKPWHIDGEEPLPRGNADTQFDVSHCDQAGDECENYA